MTEKFQGADVAFALSLAVAFVLFLIILYPFLLALILSILVVVLLWPIHEWLLRVLKGRRKAAALIAALGTVLAVIVPSGVVALLFAQQTIDLFGRLSTLLEQESLRNLLGWLGPYVQPVLDKVEELGLTSALRELASEAARFLSTRLAPAIAVVGRLIIGGFLFIIGLYYFFLDGRDLFHEVVVVTPIKDRYILEIAESLTAVLRSLFIATLLTSIVQGLLGVIAFSIVAIPNAVALAGLMAFFSLLFSFIPILGTGLVWAPVGIGLILQGRFAAGLFILAWGIVVLGSVDTFVRPVVTRAGARLHPLIVLFTLFGGIAAFGPIGAILGPMVGALTVSFAKVWEREVVPDLR